MSEGVGAALSSLFSQGGFTVPVLVGVGAVLWFALGERLYLLHRGTALPLRALLAEAEPSPKEGGTLLEIAVARTRALAASGAVTRKVAAVLFSDLEETLRRHASLVRSLVIVAPLLGLLGTVSGMVETFDSLAEMALYTQTGGIAAGVSEALLSTQVGLVIAVPGLFLGRLLDRRERVLRAELETLRRMVLTPEVFP